MSLQKTIEEIKKLIPLTKEIVKDEPIETLSARRGRKRQAIDKFAILKREYIKHMLDTSMFIIVTGSAKDEFVQTASEHFGCFGIEADLYYKDLAKRVPQVLYLNKETVSNTFDVLSRHLEDKMNELEVGSYNQLIFKGNYARSIKSAEEFTELVRLAVNQQIGAEIVGVQSVHSLVEKAIERTHADKNTVIMLTTDNYQLTLDLVNDLPRISEKVFVVNVGEVSDNFKALKGSLNAKDGSQNAVKQVLGLIKKNLKK